MSKWPRSHRLTRLGSLGRFLGFIKGIFRPITLVGSGIDVLINRGVLVPLANITALLIIANNVYKRIVTGPAGLKPRD
jgi:hypothetical protein